MNVIGTRKPTEECGASSRGHTNDQALATPPPGGPEASTAGTRMDYMSPDSEHCWTQLAILHPNQKGETPAN